MKKQIQTEESISGGNTFMDSILASWPLSLLVAALTICLGLFFIFSQSDNKPIGREAAQEYSGTFERYDISDNYKTIYLQDGESYSVYPHTETEEFRKSMESLAPGTELDISVNPNNGYVIELIAGGEELLNFELSQEAIDSYDNWYIALGIGACALGVFLIVYSLWKSIYEKKETARQKYKERRSLGKTAPLRAADTAVKCRILAQATVDGYDICYRRVKSVNELVINGKIYDEVKGILEFDHRLSARINGHTVVAGYSEQSGSYILFDDECVVQKRRIV